MLVLQPLNVSVQALQIVFEREAPEVAILAGVFGVLLCESTHGVVPWLRKKLAVTPPPRWLDGGRFRRGRSRPYRSESDRVKGLTSCHQL